MTGALTNSKKDDFEKDLNCMIDCVILQTHLFFNSATVGPFLDLDPLELLMGLESGPKTFLGPAHID